MATLYGASLPLTDLSLSLDVANPKSYPGSGTTWSDLSGNGNHATFSGSPSISNGIITFDGTDDFATISTDGTGSFDFSNEQTVVMWLKHSYTSGRRNPWDQAYGGYGTWTHEQGNNINGDYGDAGGNTPPYTSSNSGTTERNVWNCIVRGRNTSQVFWWQNGERTSTATNAYGTLTTTTNDIRIGRGYAGYWIGEMGPVLAYKRCLSDDEVLQIYNAMRGRFGR